MIRKTQKSENQEEKRDSMAAETAKDQEVDPRGTEKEVRDGETGGEEEAKASVNMHDDPGKEANASGSNAEGAEGTEDQADIQNPGEAEGTGEDIEGEEKHTEGEKETAGGEEKDAEGEEQDAEGESSEEMEVRLAEMQDRYLRLTAEYDNYRKRTLKEKLELQMTAREEVLISILPLIDDFERAMASVETAKDLDAVKEGLNLIYGKFRNFISHHGIQEIDARNKPFDTDLHEAVTKIPVQEKKKKGKVVDVIEKGYTLKDRVIRFSKVVIGE